MKIDELNLTGLEDLSGLYDHVYRQSANLGDMLKFVRLVPLIPFLAFVSVKPISKKTAKRGKESKQKCRWCEGDGSGSGSGGVVLWVTVADIRSPIRRDVVVAASVCIFEIMRPLGVIVAWWGANSVRRGLARQ
ncbi:MAG: hypothetical protein DRQ49_07260 [Gammaproteobacteria bacterium]|nr:MAG: hypothetical protein DRQ49_07260 [Gammaproteobacteria bacterium]